MILIIILGLIIFFTSCFYQTYLGLYKQWGKGLSLIIIMLCLSLFFLYQLPSHLVGYRSIILSFAPTILLVIFFINGLIFSKIMDWHQ